MPGDKNTCLCCWPIHRLVDVDMSESLRWQTIPCQFMQASVGISCVVPTSNGRLNCKYLFGWIVVARNAPVAWEYAGAGPRFQANDCGGTKAFAVFDALPPNEYRGEKSGQSRRSSQRRPVSNAGGRRHTTHPSENIFPRLSFFFWASAPVPAKGQKWRGRRAQIPAHRALD